MMAVATSSGFEVKHRTLAQREASCARQISLVVAILIGALAFALSGSSWAQSADAFDELANDRVVRLQLSDRTEWVGVLRSAGDGHLFLELAGEQLMSVDVTHVDSIALGGKMFLEDPDYAMMSRLPLDRILTHRTAGGSSELATFLSDADIREAKSQYRKGEALRNVGLSLIASAEVLLNSAIFYHVWPVDRGCEDPRYCSDDGWDWENTRNAMVGASAGSLLLGAILGAVGGRLRRTHGTAVRAIDARGDEPRIWLSGRERRESMVFHVVPQVSRAGAGARVLIGF
jgi:hypothetical protein